MRKWIPPPKRKYLNKKLHQINNPKLQITIFLVKFTQFRDNSIMKESNKHELSGSKMMLQYFVRESGLSNQEISTHINRSLIYIQGCLYKDMPVSPEMAYLLGRCLGFNYEEFLILQYREKVRRIISSMSAGNQRYSMINRKK